MYRSRQRLHEAKREIASVAPSHRPPHFSGRLAGSERYSGNRAALRKLTLARPQMQCKLQVGAVNDPLEAEADRVADHVMRMPDAGVAAHIPGGSSLGTVRRKCAECEKEEEEKMPNVQRKAEAGGAAAMAAPPIVSNVLSDPGQPLDAPTRAFFEPRIGFNLDSVRIHTGRQAAASAGAVNALAYTSGRNVVFGEGQYQPSSQAGRRLLAHELAHVAQQDGAQTLRRVCGPKAIGDPAGCDPAPPVFTAGRIFRFIVNCTDWSGGAAGDLREYAKTLPPETNIQIDGYASVDGDEAYNVKLSCARANTAKQLLMQLGIPEKRITRVVDHGPTPGNAADRRSVVVQPATAAPQPQSPTPTQNQQQPTATQNQAQPQKPPDQTQTQPQKPPDQTQTQPQKPAQVTPQKPTQTTGDTVTTGTGAAPQDPSPRLVIQIPITPLQVQLPLGGPGGLGSSGSSSALNQANQPNVAAGLVYNFSRSPDDIGFQFGGFQIGGFIQAGINTPLPGSASPLTASGNKSDFTGANVQGYLQPAYIFFAKKGYQISVLAQPGVGRTFLSPVPEENGVTYTVQGGFQVTKDIVPNRWQFFGTITGGANKTFIDDPPPGMGSEQPWQPFIGIQIGIQPIIPLINYPKE